MSTKVPVLARRTLAEFSSIKLLGLFLVPFLAVTFFVGIATSQAAPDGLAGMPLHVQEAWLARSFALLAFVWGAGVPFMVLVGVLAANGVAWEFERGTLGILLSKPVGRREVYAGKFVAVFLFAFLAMVAGVLVSAVAVFRLTSAIPAAIPGAIWPQLPGTLAYALYVSFVTAAVGSAVAVLTASRLRTVLGVLVVPGLFVAFAVARLVPTGGMYETFHLYLLDVSYHFGNAFVFVHDVAGTGFSPLTQRGLELATGAYDTTGAGIDPLVGGMPGSIPLTGYVPPAASFAALLVASVVLLAVAAVRFERMDVS